MKNKLNNLCVYRHHFGEGIYFKFQRIFLLSKILKYFDNCILSPFVYAQKIIKENTYLHFEGNYFDIQLKDISRPVIITYPEDNISTDHLVVKDSVLRLGIGLLEWTDPKVLDGTMVVNLTILGERTNKSIQFKLHLKLNTFLQTYECYYAFGKDWTDFYVNLSEFNNQTINLKMSASFEKNKRKYYPKRTPSIAWSAPQIVIKKSKQKTKRIIILVIEAMSDPIFLQQRYNVQSEMPNYEVLMDESIRAKRSYSQNDSTISSIGTILTSLHGSQHGIKDYRSIPKYYETPILSKNILTLPEILKEHQFLTVGAGSCKRTSPSYGWSRGFDSYMNALYTQHDNAPDIPWAKRALDSMIGHDGLLFLYLDFLHWPSIIFSHPRTPHIYSSDVLVEASNKEQTLLQYMERLNQVDLQIGDLISYLKKTGQYDNTQLLITGDHGSIIPPWGFNERYAFYENHIRVPFISTVPNWSSLSPELIETPFNASTNIMKTILNSLNIEHPDYFSGLPQNQHKYDNCSITETLMHPTVDDYAITIVSGEYKYVLFGKVDWGKCRFKSMEGERLYNIDIKTGYVDESRTVEIELPSIIEKYRDLSLTFINESFEFHKRFPAGNIRNDSIGWEPRKRGHLRKCASWIKRVIK